MNLQEISTEALASVVLDRYEQHQESTWDIRCGAEYQQHLFDRFNEAADALVVKINNEVAELLALIDATAVIKG